MARISARISAPYTSLLSQAGRFSAHLVEMIAAMFVGMIGAAAILALVFRSVLAPVVDGMTQRQVFNEFAVLICVAVAIGSTATMVLWMRYRGMDWRPVLEMVGAMILPLVAVFALLAVGVIPGAEACGLYCVLMVLAMVIAMVFRLDLYARHAGHHHGSQHAAHAT